MKHILFGTETNKLKTAIIIKESALRKPGILTHYINPLMAKGIALNTLVAVDLKYQANNKCTAACAKDYISVLLPALDKINITTILCADGTYFKYLTKNTKVAPFHGEIVPCTIKGFEHINIILSVNFQAIEYDPNIKSKLELSIKTLSTYLGGKHIDLGSDIIEHEEYPKTLEEIKFNLGRILHYPELTCDIETKTLDFWTAGIATITFCWNKHEGIAFPVDRGDCPLEIKRLLKQFFIDYKGNIIYHNAGYDVKVLIYELWMKEI